MLALCVSALSKHLGRLHEHEHSLTRVYCDTVHDPEFPIACLRCASWMWVGSLWLDSGERIDTLHLLGAAEMHATLLTRDHSALHGVRISYVGVMPVAMMVIQCLVAAALYPGGLRCR